MEVNIATICDGANVTDGKLNILGSFDTMFVKATPFVYPHCSIALQVLLNKDDDKVNEFTVKITDEGGKEMLKPSNFTVTRTKKSGKKSDQINIAFNIRDLQIHRLGECRVDLLKGKKVVKSIPFYVQKSLPKEQ